MSKQSDVISNICEDAEYYMVQFQSTGKEAFGKILTKEEIINLDLSKHEIYRSIDYTNGNRLFVYDLVPIDYKIIDNPLELLLKNLKQAKAIELVYPNLFDWVFNGLSIKAYAIIPSGDNKANTTISRYGGTEKFTKILRHHLRNIGLMSLGKTPIYNLPDGTEKIEETELSLGSINNFNKMYSISIKLNLSYLDIIKRSEKNLQFPYSLKTLDMKFWAREMNPDIMLETKHNKLNNPLPIEHAYTLYPQAIKNLMELPYKGDYNRFLLARFLLSVHNPKDAKFLYYSVLGNEEREHVITGDSHKQWNYIVNNMKDYGCPTKRQLRKFWPIDDESTHPLELIQEYVLKKERESGQDRPRE